MVCGSKQNIITSSSAAFRITLGVHIPLLTPSHRDDASCNLSTEEARFEARYAEWLKKNHPEAVDSGQHTSSREQPEDAVQLFTSESLHRRLSFAEDGDDDVRQLHKTTLSKTLSSMPKPTLKYPELKENISNRVLTSLDNLKKIQDKEKEKEEKAKDKQRKQKENLRGFKRKKRSVTGHRKTKKEIQEIANYR